MKFDGAHLVEKEEEEVEEVLNEDEMIGFIMRKTAKELLNYEEVKAVLDAETEYLKEKGFISD